MLGDDTETDDVSPELTQIMDHVNIEVIWAGARIEIDMPDTRRSRSTKNEHPLGSEALVRGLGGGSFAPFPHFSPIFPLSRKSLKFRHFRHILP